MLFGFLNNFADQLAAPVSDTATSIELAGKASDIQTALQSADAVALTLFVTDDQGNETQREVVYATAATPPLVTVTRAQEGTTAVTFLPGDSCENRLTAGVISESFLAKVAAGDNSGQSSVAIESDSEASGPHSIAVGYRAIATQSGTSPPSGSMALGLVATALGDGAIAIGGNNSSVLDAERGQRSYSAGAFANGYMTLAISAGAQALGSSTTAIGNYALANSYGSLAICEAAEATADQSLSLGVYAKSTASDTITLGAYSETTNATGVTVGANAYNEGEGAVCLGAYSSASAGTTYSVAIGESATVDAGSSNIAIGDRSAVGGIYATALGGNSWAPGEGSVALGAGAFAAVDSGCRITGVQYLPKAVEVDASLRPGSYYDPTSSAFNHVSVAALRTSSQITLATDAIDLTTAGAAFELSLPASTMMFIESLDVVVVESDGAGGLPEFQVGPDASSPASYLAATAVNKTAVGGREVHSPLVTDGVTALRASVATAGTGIAYSVKVVARGYVMEV